MPTTERPTPTSRPLTTISSFPVYNAGDDEVPRTSTPDPIKVTRPKKKGTGTGKKKRTAKVENGS